MAEGAGESAINRDRVDENNHEVDGNCLGNGHEKNDEGDALTNARPTYGNVVARMPTARFDKFYNMSHKSRGIAFIFNHEKFEVANLKPRAGTDEDRKNLEDALRKLGFVVSVFQDLKYADIEHHLKRAATTDHSHFDCVCIAVLSHGDNGIIYARDMPYKTDTLWARFTADRCPTLAGKPKIFLLQACQGDKLDGGVILSRTETDGQPMNSYRIPSQADFVVVYSTVKGYYSWRNTTRGSWFVQALCEELRENAFNYDLLTLLTFVSQRVAFDYQSNTPDSPTMHEQKQIPCIMSMLTRLVQFTPHKAGFGNSLANNEPKTEEKKGIFSGIFNKSKA